MMAVISALFLETAAKAQFTARVFGRINPLFLNPT